MRHKGVGDEESEAARALKVQEELVRIEAECLHDLRIIAELEKQNGLSSCLLRMRAVLVAKLAACAGGVPLV